MSRSDRIGVGMALLVLLGLSVGNGLTIYEQQQTLDTTINTMATMNADDARTQERIWDLHRRVTRLENEAQRLHEHIKWFVMRRSGTDELRKMEAAIQKLKESHVTGD